MAQVIYLCTDLLFTSKIREVARQVGATVEGVRDAAQLKAAAQAARLVIVDLRRPDALEALDGLPAGVQAVGFIDHEREDVMEAARARGCRALAKGKFATELPLLVGTL
jgi:hypothetical protein